MTSAAAAPIRRNDPERRDRIIDAALQVIARDGVAGTSHRRVAAEADVPLGSMTYHFTGMDELLTEAFTRFADRAADDFEARMARATGPAEAAAAVVSLIDAEPLADPSALVVTHELYTLAARDPRFRTITRHWMARSRRSLERWFDPTTARVLDALVEGLTIHRALDVARGPAGVADAAVRRVVGGRDVAG